MNYDTEHIRRCTVLQVVICCSRLKTPAHFIVSKISRELGSAVLLNLRGGRICLISQQFCSGRACKTAHYCSLVCCILSQVILDSSPFKTKNNPPPIIVIGCLLHRQIVFNFFNLWFLNWAAWLIQWWHLTIHSLPSEMNSSALILMFYRYFATLIIMNVIQSAPEANWLGNLNEKEKRFLELLLLRISHTGMYRISS